MGRDHNQMERTLWEETINKYDENHMGMRWIIQVTLWEETIINMVRTI